MSNTKRSRFIAGDCKNAVPLTKIIRPSRPQLRDVRRYRPESVHTDPASPGGIVCLITVVRNVSLYKIFGSGEEIARAYTVVWDGWAARWPPTGAKRPCTHVPSNGTVTSPDHPPARRSQRT